MTNQQPSGVASSFVANNPHLADIIEKNIHTIVNLRRRAADHRTTQERLADAITGFSGRMAFVYFHIVVDVLEEMDRVQRQVKHSIGA